MTTDYLPHDSFDPDSDIPDHSRKLRRTEYWAFALFGLLTVPWICGVIYIAKAVAGLFRR
jgi:hypothetical protein